MCVYTVYSLNILNIIFYNRKSIISNAKVSQVLGCLKRRLWTYLTHKNLFPL